MVGLLIAGCVTCPEVEPIEDRIVPMVHQTYLESGDARYRDTFRGIHPAESEITVEIVSDNQVRVSYEHDGQEVVEIYAVSERLHLQR